MLTSVVFTQLENWFTVSQYKEIILSKLISLHILFIFLAHQCIFPTNILHNPAFSVSAWIVVNSMDSLFSCVYHTVMFRRPGRLGAHGCAGEQDPLIKWGVFEEHLNEEIRTEKKTDIKKSIDMLRHWSDLTDLSSFMRVRTWIYYYSHVFLRMFLL